MSKTLDLIITDPGDPSVGIFSQTWEILSVIVESESRQQIRDATQEYFQRYIAGEAVSVMFSDEIPYEERKQARIASLSDEIKNKCPKCGSSNSEMKTSSGGSTVYLKGKCNDCGFEGGHVRLSENRKQDYRDVNDRFALDSPCDVESFVSTLLGSKKGESQMRKYQMLVKSTGRFIGNCSDRSVQIGGGFRYLFILSKNKKTYILRAVKKVDKKQK